MIGQYIAEALSKKERVIVPKLGTFFATFSNADISEHDGLLTPPSYEVRFTEEINTFDEEHNLTNIIFEHGSEMLASQIDSQVETYVDGLLKQLDDTGRAEIEDLGHLEAGPEGKLVFIQAPGLQLLSDSFGLPKITARPLEALETAEEPENAAGQAKRAVRLWLFALPLIAVAAAVAYAAFVPGSVPGIKKFFGITQEQSLSGTDGNDREMLADPEGDKPVEPTPENQDVAADAEKPGTTPAEKPIQKPTAVPEPTATATDNPVVVQSPSKRHYVIIGSYTNLALAKKAAEAMRAKGDGRAKVVAAEGKFRVAVTDYASRQEAEAALAGHKDRFNGAWILNY